MEINAFSFQSTNANPFKMLNGMSINAFACLAFLLKDWAVSAKASSPTDSVTYVPPSQTLNGSTTPVNATKASTKIKANAFPPTQILILLPHPFAMLLPFSTTSKKDACHALMDVFPAHHATLAHNADHSTTSTPKITFVMRYVETERDSHWAAMTATIKMETAALVIARFRQVTAVLEDHRIHLTLAPTPCQLRLLSPNLAKVTSLIRLSSTLDWTTFQCNS